MITTFDSEKGRVLDGLVPSFGIAVAGLPTGFAGFQSALALGTPRGAQARGGGAAVVLSRANVTQRLSEGSTRHDQARRITMLYPTLDAAGAIIADRRRQAEQARRARRPEHNEMSDLELTVEAVIADSGPGWLTSKGVLS